ncbi:mucin-5AC-like [Ornithodoros turicata]|uniref:mucin-5AC-like n=1 Tax=Ornithodoros turicata TaxID=34597 RepID=UPI00313A159E
MWSRLLLCLFLHAIYRGICAKPLPRSHNSEHNEVLWIWIPVTAWLPVHKHALVPRNVQSEGTEERTGGASSTSSFPADQPISMGVTATAAGIQHVHTGEPTSGEKNYLLQGTSTLPTATARRRPTDTGNLRTQSSHDTSRRSHWTEAQHAELHETTLPTVDMLISTRTLDEQVESSTETGLDDRLHGTAKTNSDTFTTVEGDNTQTSHDTMPSKVPFAEPAESHAEMHATLSTLEHATTTKNSKVKDVRDTDLGMSVTPNSTAGANDDMHTTLGRRNPQAHHDNEAFKVSTEGEEDLRTTLSTWTLLVVTRNVMGRSAPNTGAGLTGETDGRTEATANNIPTKPGGRNRQTRHCTWPAVCTTEGHAGPRATLLTLVVLATTQNVIEEDIPNTDIGPNGTWNGVMEVNAGMPTTVEKLHRSTRATKESLNQTTEENRAMLQITTATIMYFTSTQNSKKQDESSAATGMNGMPSASGNKSSHLDTTTATLNNSPNKTTTTEEQGEPLTTTVTAAVSTQDITQNTKVPEIPHMTSITPPNESGRVHTTAEDQKSKDSTPSSGPNGTTTDGLTELLKTAVQTQGPPTSTHTSKDEVSNTDPGTIDKSTQRNIVSPATVDQSAQFNNSTAATKESRHTTTVGQAQVQLTTVTTHGPTTNVQVSDRHGKQSTPEPATETGDGVSTQSDTRFKIAQIQQEPYWARVM